VGRHIGAVVKRRRGHTSKPKEDRRESRESQRECGQDGPEHEEVERNEAKGCAYVRAIDLTVPVIAREGGSELHDGMEKTYQKKFLLISTLPRPKVIFRIVVQGVLVELDASVMPSDCTMISSGGPWKRPLGTIRSNCFITMLYSC
jgi:hypothetical protein